MSASDGGVITGRLQLQRKQENQRLYDLRLTWWGRGGPGGLHQLSQSQVLLTYHPITQ